MVLRWTSLVTKNPLSQCFRGFFVLGWTALYSILVPGAGVEPARRSAPDFKSGMSTSFIIRARGLILAHLRRLG